MNTLSMWAFYEWNKIFMFYYLLLMELEGEYGLVLSLHWNFISVLFLQNYLLNFNKTFRERSIPKGDSHIHKLVLFWSMYTELWPLVSFAVCIQSNIHFCARLLCSCNEMICIMQFRISCSPCLLVSHI